MIRAGIYGASGYSGFELVKLLRAHPEAEIGFATSRSYAGQRLSDAFPTAIDQPPSTWCSAACRTAPRCRWCSAPSKPAPAWLI